MMAHPLESMTVAQVSRRTGATSDAIRYYCRIGLLRPRRDRRSGYKRFGAVDLQRLQFIAKAKRLGFTLAEIAEIIRRSTSGHAPCPVVRSIVTARVLENDRRLADVLALHKRMKTAAAEWERLPDKVPDGDAVCHLIESFVDVNASGPAASSATSRGARWT